MFLPKKLSSSCLKTFVNKKQKRGASHFCLPYLKSADVTFVRVGKFEGKEALRNVLEKVTSKQNVLEKTEEKGCDNMITRNVGTLQFAEILVLEYGILLFKTVNAYWKFRDLQRPCPKADLVKGIRSLEIP